VGSDLARVSYDPSRHWRGVISQQGRVTVEADYNEANRIAAEENRAQLLDVIGPTGTGNGGYAVTPDPGGDIAVARGTLYVGGQRMVLDSDVSYAEQSEWIDFDGDPFWTENAKPQGNELVYLLLREQEVGAVEDPALLDVALGGPDTSERRRIVQRIVRRAVGSASTDCAAALADLGQVWSELGLSFEPQTMRLKSSATLQVSFQEPRTAPTPCEPAAQGGFLGAENQLIRVQVASVDENAVPTLVWGFDNAHFTYRIADPVIDSAAQTTTLTLTSTPVDAFHQPTAGQAVEVLRAAAQLTAGDYIAAASGLVTTLASDYQPSTQQVQLTTALNGNTTDSPLLFLRVWQGTVVAQDGPVALGNTGIEVTVSPGGGSYHVGDYWLFAVRPGAAATGSQIYPERIFEAPQPPDGPRLWACPLALVAWAGASPAVTDCRKPFENLVDALAALTATRISFDPGACEVLKGSHTVADALDLLCQHAEQGDDFCLALLRLFGRGVICGLIPSITVTPPDQGATDVPIEITATDGTMIDGRGCVVTLSKVPPLDITVPAVNAGGAGVEVKQWLYLVSAPGQTPELQLQPNPPAGRMTLSDDLVAALDNPSSGPVIPASATCSDAENDAWQVFGKVDCVITNGDAGVCLGVVGVQGPAGWTSPDDREQIFPTPAMTSARWLIQRQPTYDLIKAACVAGAVTVQSIVVGDASGQNLAGQALLGGTSGRQATVLLDDVVRGTDPLAITLQSSGGVSVHGPVAIAPGQNSASFTFDLADVAGPQSITAVIDAQRQLQVSFTAVQVQSPVLAGNATAVMAGDPVSVSVSLSVAATESVTINVSGLNVSTAVIVISPGTISQSGQVTAASTGEALASATAQVTAGGVVVQGPRRNFQFFAVGLFNLVNANGASIDNAFVITGNSIPGVTVRLTTAAPYPLNLSISIVPQTAGALPALVASPSAVTVATGQTASTSFTLSSASGQLGAQNVVATYNAIQVSARVTVSKGKEHKEEKEKDNIIDKTPAKDKADKLQEVEKIDVVEKVGGREILPRVAEPVGVEPQPQGQAFVGPALRPVVGGRAFGASANGEQQ
jgi:hypothetical protein